jgi:hypothetical protein
MIQIHCIDFLASEYDKILKEIIIDRDVDLRKEP